MSLPSSDIEFVDSDDEAPKPPPPKKPKQAKQAKQPEQPEQAKQTKVAEVAEVVEVTRKNHFLIYGSHELTLAHHMQLSAGFTLQNDDANNVQIVWPKRTRTKNELKSFRARLAKHLRAIGFVSKKDDDKAEDVQFAALSLPPYVWIRPSTAADGTCVALNEYTLRPNAEANAPDPALHVDPFAGL